jgi:hypothetical protein
MALPDQIAIAASNLRGDMGFGEHPFPVWFLSVTSSHHIYHPDLCLFVNIEFLLIIFLFKLFWLWYIVYRTTKNQMDKTRDSIGTDIFLEFPYSIVYRHNFVFQQLTTNFL